jgi:uncharacterized protein (DUF39 family)
LAAIVIAFYVIEATDFKKFISYFIPHYGAFIGVFVGIVIVIVYEEIQKSSIREQFDIDGKMMNIFFTTRLGMWSPR